MENYEGPVVVRIPPRGTKHKSAKEQVSQFNWLPFPITEPMTGFSHASVTKSVQKDLFDVPKQTSVVIDDLQVMHAIYVAEPDMITYLKQVRLDKGLYTMAEIKAVLYLHGISIPKNVKVKKDYENLARASGIVSRL